MADKIVQALVTQKTFINNVLYHPGEVATVNLTELGIDSLDDKHDPVDGEKVGKSKTPGLELYAKKDGEHIELVPVAAVSPHAPNPANAQGIPPGTITSGTGRLLSPADPGSPDDVAREMVAPVVDAKELDPDSPAGRKAKA